jgi:hypothetical protein
MYNVSENYGAVFKNCCFETTGARKMNQRQKECKRNC